MDKTKLFNSLKKILRKNQRYRIKEHTKIRKDRTYELYVFDEDESINLFKSVMVTEAKDKEEFNFWKNKYDYQGAYFVDFLIVFYKNKLLVRHVLGKNVVVRNINRINKSFERKLKNALENPGKETFSKVFDRSDIIEEFYQLYRKSRDYFLENIKGISDEDKRKEFIDNLMMQMITLWYLQEKGFFNNDKNYFITKFEETQQQKLENSFPTFYDFLRHFFEKISGTEDKQYCNDESLGNVVVIGPAVFLNGDTNVAGIEIPDKCFYKKGATDKLINQPPKKVSEVPLLNLFESRDWVDGNIDEFVLGAIYEKLINYNERKKTGAYYTPEQITKYICENTIKPYLLDRMKEKFGKEFKENEEKRKDIFKFIESANDEQLRYLFGLVKEIKIVDPAVGSAHFLESAINLLVEIYEKIWGKREEIKGNWFKIKTSNEKGQLKEIDLREIKNEEEFRLYVKFFIILSENIYGVDINPNALKVAKARLFLNMAKHFKKGGEREIFIRFPNVHFNLRCGNSLIGYVDLEKSSKGQQGVLVEFFDYSQHIEKKIKAVEELEEYFAKVAKELSLGENLRCDLQRLNEILSKDELLWNDFNSVLKIKKKLTKVLIVSLNSKYARALNDLLNEINKEFNSKLNEKFADDNGIKIEDLKKIKTFHWIFEFPEVFLRENPGFDVVVGNPPYGNILSDLEKRILNTNNKNIAVDFIDSSTNLVNSFGYAGLIVPHSISRASIYLKIRKKIYKNKLLWKVVDIGNPFEGVTLEMILLFLNKYHNKNIELVSLRNNFTNLVNYKKGFIKEKYYRILIYRDKFYEFINSKKMVFPFSGIRGHDILINSDTLSKKFCKHCLWFLRGKNVDKFRLTSIESYDRYINKKYAKGSFIFEEAVVITQFGTNLKAAKIYGEKHYPSGGLIIVKSNLKPEMTLMILNSNLINTYLQRYVFNCAQLTVHMDGIYLEEIPVPKISKKIEEIYSKAEKKIENLIKKGFIKDALLLNEALIIDLYFYKNFELVKNLNINNAKSILRKFKEEWGQTLENNQMN